MSVFEITVLVLLFSLVGAEISFRIFLARKEKTRIELAKDQIREKQLEMLARQYNLDIAVVKSVCQVMGDESIADGTLAQALSTF